jgi:hypothetical protein
MLRSLVTALFILFVAGAASHAHHSYAEFDDRVVSLDGTVEKIDFINPHTLIALRAKDKVHTIIWNAAFQLDRMGVDARALKVGDRLIVTGTPARDPASRQLSRLSEVRRPKDGWRWSSNDQGRGPSVTTSSR